MRIYSICGCSWWIYSQANPGVLEVLKLMFASTASNQVFQVWGGLLQMSVRVTDFFQFARVVAFGLVIPNRWLLVDVPIMLLGENVLCLLRE